MRQILICVFLQWAALSAQAVPFNLESGYEYWDLSFFAPSRNYRLAVNRAPGGAGPAFEYARTDRFNRLDNTFSAGWIQPMKGWGWQAQAALTPKAAIMYRHMESAAIYLPSPLKGAEPFVTGFHRLYTEARNLSGSFGWRQDLGKGFDLTGQAGKTKTHLLKGNKTKHSTGTSALEAGCRYKTARVFVWKAHWKEFFDSGGPTTGAFSSTEIGGGVMAGEKTRLRLSYAQEERTSKTLIHKTALSVTIPL